MKLDIYKINAFSEKLFKGNPAAVIPLEQWLPDNLMQNIAYENHLSETAFFIPSDKVYKSDTLFAINDINPQAPTHILIIPRIHQASLLDVEAKDHTLMGSVISVANHLAKERGLDTSGYRLVVNCGSGAGQSVYHIHFHLLGGRALSWPPG